MSKASQIRQKAQEFLSKGQTDKAIQEYRRLISIESKNPNLYNELGDIYLRASDRDQAVLNFEKAAVIYEKVALYNNAVAVCKKILRVTPEKVDTIFKLAELRAKQKLEGEAVTYFSQYVEYVLASPQGLLQHSQKDAERMLELIPGSEPIIDKASEIYEQLGLRLKAAELYVKLSSIATTKGDVKKGAHYRRKIEELRSLSAPEEIEEMDRFTAGEKVVEAGGPADAEGQTSVSASADEQSSAAAEAPLSEAGLAEATSGTGSPPDASLGGGESASRAFEEEPSASEDRDPGLDSSIREAVEEAEMVAAMSQGHEAFSPGGAAGERAEEEVSSPSWQQSESAIGLNLETEAPDAGVSRAGEPSSATRQARTFPETEDHNNLAEEITSDVEKDDLKSHYDLGMAYLEMGLYTEAIKDFQIASRSAELQLSSMEMIGYCFFKHGQPRLAVKQLTRALDIAKASSAENLGIHYNLGLSYEMLGELESAREHFEEVYIIDMSFRDVSDKMKRLSTIS